MMRQSFKPLKYKFNNWLLASLSLVLISISSVASSQSPFTSVAFVNDAVITTYEVNQRVRLLEVLQTAGDLNEIALERLVDERLRMQAAARAGIAVTPAGIADGIEEFAGRVDLDGNQFIANLQQEGVAPDSFREFIRAGIAWRELVRGRFSAAAAINDAEIDREISPSGTSGSARVLISEIFLPVNTPENEAITLELIPQIARLTTVAEFADAARRFSAGPSRERGGVVNDWVPLENLPPQIRQLLLTMKPGQVTNPIEIPNALALFQLRALQETVAPANPNPVLEYATYLIDGGRSDAALARAAQVRNQVDTCDDLYAVAKNQPIDVLERNALPLTDIPTDLALALAQLDPDETSTALTRSNGQTLVFLMLCERNRNPNIEISRNQIRQRLSNARLNGLSDAYLGELRANASIRYP